MHKPHRSDNLFLGNHTLHDTDNVISGFRSTENHFRKALAQAPVMIYMSKVNVFHHQMP